MSKGNDSHEDLRQAIQQTRKVLELTAQENGLDDSTVLQLSRELDELILRAQQGSGQFQD